MKNVTYKITNSNGMAGGVSRYNATLHERGNGLPDVGDYVPGDDGCLYRVVTMQSRIHTGAAGCGNYVHAQVEPADWADCEEGEESTCLAVVEVRDEEEDAAARADHAYDEARDWELTHR